MFRLTYQLTAAGGTISYTYAQTGGALHLGLSLNTRPPAL